MLLKATANIGLETNELLQLPGERLVPADFIFGFHCSMVSLMISYIEPYDGVGEIAMTTDGSRYIAISTDKEW